MMACKYDSHIIRDLSDVGRHLLCVTRDAASFGVAKKVDHQRIAFDNLLKNNLKR